MSSLVTEASADVHPSSESLMPLFVSSCRSAGYKANSTRLKTSARADVGVSLNGNDVIASDQGMHWGVPSTDDTAHQRDTTPAGLCDSPSTPEETESAHGA